MMADISGETIHCGAVSISLKNQMFTNQESISCISFRSVYFQLPQSMLGGDFCLKNPADPLLQ